MIIVWMYVFSLFLFIFKIEILFTMDSDSFVEFIIFTFKIGGDFRGEFFLFF